MVLPDHELIELGPSMIFPFDASLVQPSSVDVRLGNTFRIFTAHRTDCVDLSDPATFAGLTDEIELEDGEKFTLHPGEFALGGTLEEFHVPPNLVMRLEGKSSVGRLGLIVHATAGYADPGFEGPITLEFSNLLRVPIKMTPGLTIAQMSFAYLSSPAENPYHGRYQHSKAATASRYTG